MQPPYRPTPRPLAARETRSSLSDTQGLRILLPPSETKTPATRGNPVDLDALSFPVLKPCREKLIDEIAAVSARPNAAALLDIPKGAAAQLAHNVALRTAPAQRVDRLYAGVLYDALDLASLEPAAKRRASRSVVISSALFGALRLVDRVPAYRLSMGTAVPHAGPLASFWREPLLTAMASHDDGRAIVDMRSGAYAAAWRPPFEAAERLVKVNVVRDRAGKRTVVSHMAKFTRGLVARLLVQTAAPLRAPEDVAGVVERHMTVELDDPRPNRPRCLTVVETA